MSSFRRVALGIALVSAMHITLWAQTNGTGTGRSSGTVPASPEIDGKANKPGAALPREESTLGEDPDNHLILPFARHLVSDQQAFWTAPAHFSMKDLEWIAPFTGITAGFIASDSWISKQIPLGKVQTSKTISNYGVYSLIAAGGGAYILGHVKGDDRMSETGLLSG
jgi:hypothetical protein